MTENASPAVSLTLAELGAMLADAAERGIQSGKAGTNVDVTAQGIALMVILKADLHPRMKLSDALPEKKATQFPFVGPLS